MWNLAFFFTIKHGGATAFKSFTSIRSFITFHGIFMAPGYELGSGSIAANLLFTKEPEIIKDTDSDSDY